MSICNETESVSLKLKRHFLAFFWNVCLLIQREEARAQEYYQVKATERDSEIISKPENRNVTYFSGKVLPSNVHNSTNKAKLITPE